MKVLILYKSFLGSTQKYAEWLAEEVGGDAFRWNEAQVDDFKKYDVVVVSSGTYAGWMPLTGYLKKRWKYLKDKHIVVLAVGAAPEEVKWSKISESRIAGEIQKDIKYFKVRGKMKEEPDSLIKKENLAPVVKYIRSLDKK